jgi:uncharacterized protein (DUF433 family)
MDKQTPQAIDSHVSSIQQRKTLLARLDEGRRQLDQGDFTTYDKQGLKDYFDDVHRRGMERRRISAPLREVNMSTTSLDAMLVATPGTCGGRLRIDGTRITVHRIATLYKQGQSAEDIYETYPHLSLGQVYTALAYYHAHREKIDAELATEDAEYDKLKRESFAAGK